MGIIFAVVTVLIYCLVFLLTPILDNPAFIVVLIFPALFFYVFAAIPYFITSVVTDLFFNYSTFFKTGDTVGLIDSPTTWGWIALVLVSACFYFMVGYIFGQSRNTSK